MSDDDIIKEAKKRFDRCEKHEKEARSRAREDIKFAHGDSRNGWQWDDAVRGAREGDDRPCLTTNKTQQHNLLIINDARENKSSPKVSPVGDGATYDAAQVFNGLFRHIENQSNAQDAYSKAITDQVEGGFGWVRVVTDYASEEVGASAFNQEIFIRRVKDQFSVFIDPDCEEADKSDARFGFVFTDMPRDEAEKKWPIIKNEGAIAPLGHDDEWDTEDYIREAEYYRLVDRKVDTIYQIADQVVPESQMSQEALEGVRTLGLPKRDLMMPMIEWYRIVGENIVERQTETVWRYVPLVMFAGIEFSVAGEFDRAGHTRALIDPQRMYNYWISVAAESAGYQTIVPWITPIEAVEGHQAAWEDANRSGAAYLPYNHMGDDGNPIPPPQRAEPPVMPQAAMQGQQTALNDMMMVSGQYQAEMGAESNERSGRAITERQRQADKATYHFVDRAAQAMRLVAKIMLAAIPHVYDTKRVVRILEEDGTENHVILDPDAQAAHQPIPGQQQGAQKAAAIFNPTIGNYAVVADVGPSFATKRQDAFNAFGQIMQANPDMMKLAGDILFRAADFPFADELAERLKRSIPPQLLEDGPDPRLMQLQQKLAQQQQLMTHMMQDYADMQRKLQYKDQDIERQNYEAETKRFSAVGAVDPAALMPIIRSMVSEILNMPANPVIAAHQAHDAAVQQAIAPPEPDQNQGQSP